MSTVARFDLERLVEGFRRCGGDDVAELARRDYGGDPVTDAEWALVFAAFGPRVPDQQQLGRRMRNPGLGSHGMGLLRKLDIVDQLAHIDCPTLVCVGELDPVTPVDASREIVGALPRGAGRLEVIEGAGHFPWKDAPGTVLACDGGLRGLDVGSLKTNAHEIEQPATSPECR